MSRKATCSRSYHETAHSDIEAFAISIGTGISTHAATFPDPPVSRAQLIADATDYQVKYGAYHTGGSAQKGLFLAAKAVIMDDLDRTAGYVDEIADGNVAIISMAGFTPITTAYTSSVVPAAPVGIKVSHGASGSFRLRCGAMKRATYYVCIATEHPLPPGAYLNGTLNTSALTGLVVIDMNKGRIKTMSGFTPAIVYYFYFFAGNTAGTSNLSAVMSMMAM